MMESDRLTHKPTQAIDATVDGLFAGLLAGGVMMAGLVLMGAIQGASLADTLSRFAVNAPKTPLNGLLLHLAVSSVYGMLYGVTWSFAQQWLRYRMAGWISIIEGLVFSLLLAFVAQAWIIPNTAAGLEAIPAIQFFSAHLIYGACLGWYFSRKSKYTSAGKSRRG
jgi:hypothetical protein